MKYRHAFLPLILPDVPPPRICHLLQQGVPKDANNSTTESHVTEDVDGNYDDNPDKISKVQLLRSKGEVAHV
ncbi:hypothetical protein TIFTF001_024140 [Ficus carica]|uniref:Uncharacterized protein n=1 Tax=Ficus carica TaxID=3494 RepID=A0AA88AVG5_FICCA|nr:hypothetical protein TIFTF001_024140 [Ficus carica]